MLGTDIDGRGICGGRRFEGQKIILRGLRETMYAFGVSHIKMKNWNSIADFLSTLVILRTYGELIVHIYE